MIMEHFRIHSINIRGLNSNFDSLVAHTCLHRPHILCLTEVQIINLDNNKYHINGYTLIDNLAHHRGVMIYCRNDVSFSTPKIVHHSVNSEFNSLWIELRISKHILFLCALYRSPNMSDDDTSREFDILSDSIEQIFSESPTAEIVITGDFNIYNDRWLRYSKPRTPSGETVELFAALNNLTQLVDNPTRIPDRDGDASHLLDLFLTSHPDKYKVDVQSPIGSSDHCLICADFPMLQPTPDEQIPNRVLWHYSNANWQGLNEFFQNFNWAMCFDNKDVNSIALLISTVILTGMKEFIPSSFAKKRKAFNIDWFNEACRFAINLRDKAHKIYKSSPTSENLANFKAARHNTKVVIAKQKHLQDLKVRDKMRQILQASSNKKSFWTFAGQVRQNFLGSSSSSISHLKVNNEIFTTAMEKANILASHFSKCSTLSDSEQSPPSSEPSGSFMRQVFFRTRVVAKTLKSVNAKKAVGPDGIPPIVLKNCYRTLASPLSRLFYASMKTGQFPSIWKTANIQPVPKKGDKSNPSNYRPIAIVSIMSKVMETIVNDQILKYLELNRLISDRQYGFRRKRSAGDLMIYLTDLWNRKIHMMGEVQAVALDISKAFDRVWHKALLVKLGAMGLHSSLVNWIENFLSHRKIQVVVDGATSRQFLTNAGVPQGSVISPTLFLIFINDLLSSTVNPIYSYADDSTLTSSYSYSKPSSCNSSSVSKDRENMISSLSQDLSTIIEWGKANRVEFNADKFQACLFTQKRDRPALSPLINGHAIDNSPSIHMLGMDLSGKLSWKDHIFTVGKNAAKSLGFLRRCKFYFTPSELMSIYKAYIRPHMEYNSHVWAGSPKTHLAVLDRIQNRASRMIGDENITSSLQSLEHRRDIGALCVFYKYYHGACSAEIKELMPLRRHFERPTRLAHRVHEHTLEPIFGRTKCYRSSYFPRTCGLWNDLDDRVFPESYNLQIFKKRINTHTC